MKTNQLVVFSKFLKGAHSLPVIPFKELTFNKLSVYFVDCRSRYKTKLSMKNDFIMKVRELLVANEDAFQPLETQTYSYVKSVE